MTQLPNHPDRGGTNANLQRLLKVPDVLTNRLGTIDAEPDEDLF